jgi:hypothetical protein
VPAETAALSARSCSRSTCIDSNAKASAGS